MLEGGTQSFEVVLTRELEVLPIVMGVCVWGGGTKSFHPLKGGAHSFRQSLTHRILYEIPTSEKTHEYDQNCRSHKIDCFR